MKRLDEFVIALDEPEVAPYLDAMVNGLFVVEKHQVTGDTVLAIVIAMSRHKDGQVEATLRPTGGPIEW